MDMTKARPLLPHLHPLSSPVAPRGPPNKVGVSKVKLSGTLAFTHLSRTLAETEKSKEEPYNDF